MLIHQFKMANGTENMRSHMKIYEKAKDGMASYVTTMQAAETS